MARSAAHLGELARAERYPAYVVQETGAWETASMVRRYAHLAPAHLAAHAEVVANVLVTTTAQSGEEKGASRS